MKKEIAILLPYKEKYTLKDAAAASIWVKDYLKISSLYKQTLVFGNLPKNKKPLTLKEQIENNTIGLKRAGHFKDAGVELIDNDKYLEINWKQVIKASMDIININI